MRQIRQQIFRQIVQIRRSNTDVFQGEFVQDDVKFASRCRNTMLQGVRQTRGNDAAQQSERYCKAVRWSLCGVALITLYHKALCLSSIACYST